MPTFTRFAVVGNGHLGKLLVKALAERPSISVLLLSRTEVLPADDAKSAKIDYANPSQILDTLKEHKIQVVLSALGNAAELAETQTILADVAKSAGVQLFVPSEYGFPEPLPGLEQIFIPKIQVAEHLQSIGLPSLRIYSGMWHERITWVVGYPANKKFNLVPGTENTKVSIISVEDIAGFVVYATTTLTPAQLANKSFRIHGSFVTFDEIAETLGIPVVRVDAVPESELSTVVQKALIASGKGDVLSDLESGSGKEEGLSNSLWEGHQWKTLKETVQL